MTAMTGREVFTDVTSGYGDAGGAGLRHGGAPRRPGADDIIIGLSSRNASTRELDARL
jgi:hypothetical protein